MTAAVSTAMSVVAGEERRVPRRLIDLITSTPGSLFSCVVTAPSTMSKCRKSQPAVMTFGTCKAAHRPR
jgi:hypothetical protein